MALRTLLLARPDQLPDVCIIDAHTTERSYKNSPRRPTGTGMSSSPSRLGLTHVRKPTLTCGGRTPCQTWSRPCRLRSRGARRSVRTTTDSTPGSSWRAARGLRTAKGSTRRRVRDIVSNVTPQERIQLARQAYEAMVRAVRAKSTPQSWARLLRMAHYLRAAIAEAEGEQSWTGMPP